MRKIQFNENFLQLVNLVDLKHLQDANEETAESVVSSFLPAGVNACVLSGCKVTKNGNDYTVTAGFIYFDGVIYPVEAHSFTTINVPHWAFAISYLASDPIPLSNGNTYQAHQVGKAQLVDNVGQPEIIGAYNEVYTVQQYVANMANVGTIQHFDAGFDMYDAQGAGIGYNVGWQICNGQNGAPNYEDKFILGAKADLSNVGATGGAKEQTLVIENVPKHNHADGAYNELVKSDGQGTVIDFDTDATNVQANILSTGTLKDAGGDPALGGAPRPFSIMPPHYALAIRRRMV